MEIVTAFPTPILICDDYDKSKLNEYEKYLKKDYFKTERNNYMNVDSTWTTTNLIDDSFFNDLKKFLISNISYFANQLGFVNFKTIEILNMWHNISKPGDSLFTHIHKGSLISGAFYIKGDGNKITFHNKELFMSWYLSWGRKKIVLACDVFDNVIVGIPAQTVSTNALLEYDIATLA